VPHVPVQTCRTAVLSRLRAMCMLRRAVRPRKSRRGTRRRGRAVTSGSAQRAADLYHGPAGADVPSRGASRAYIAQLREERFQTSRVYACGEPRANFKDLREWQRRPYGPRCLLRQSAGRRLRAARQRRHNSGGPMPKLTRRSAQTVEKSDSRPSRSVGVPTCRPSRSV
jgi:hypothetical protein